MKLDDALDQLPWAETREILCGEPWAVEALHLDTAERLIVQQRASQLEVLVRLMLSPVLEPKPAAPVDDPRRTVTDLPGQVFELRDPRRTARLFVDRAARTGKDLRPFRDEDLNQLDDSNAQLGRLLRLLAVAHDSSRVERAAMRGEWRAIASDTVDMVPVLTPMLYSRDGRVDALWLSLWQAPWLRACRKLQTRAHGEPANRSSTLGQQVSCVRESRV